MAIAALIGIGFSAFIFQDIFLLLAFVILIAFVAGEALWMIFIATRPKRFFSIVSLTNGESSTSRITFPLEEDAMSFLFTKKLKSSVRILSPGKKNSFLRFSPNQIQSNEKSIKIIAIFKTPYSGEYKTTDIQFLVAGPLQLFEAKARVPYTFSYTVYPRVIDIAITSSKILGKGGIGEFPTDAPGIGTEFYEIRPYSQTDDMRKINWNATAKRRELMVNERAKEVGATYYIVLEAQAANYFDRDRLASTFLQLANSLAYIRGTFGLVIHDGKNVQFLRRLDSPFESLKFALQSALIFAQIDLENVQSISLGELDSLPTQKINSLRETLSKQGHTILSQIEEFSRASFRNQLSSSDAYETIVSLVKEREGEPPAILYVSGMFNPFSLDQVVELSSQLRRVYASEFIVINPTAPWVVAPTLEEQQEAREKYSKALRVLDISGIDYHLGEPAKVAQQIFAA